MKEIWKDVKEYENHYQVSNLGRIKSLTRERVNPMIKKPTLVKGRILKPTLDKSGYYYVHLPKNENTNKKIKVHRLVAEAFIPNPNNYNEVNHKDGNKLNNSIDNLEWVTHRENMQHAYRTKLMNNRKAIIQLKDGKEIARYEGIRVAERETGVKSTGISACASGKYKTYKGYSWRYVNE